MEFNTTEEIIHKAREFWDSGDSWSAGKLVDSHIPIEKRAKWMAGVLDVVAGMFEKDASIEEIIDFARNPNKFGKGLNGNGKAAHQVVDNVNRFPYKLEEFPLTIFFLTPHAVKWIFTSQVFVAPFIYVAPSTLFELPNLFILKFQNKQFKIKFW